MNDSNNIFGSPIYQQKNVKFLNKFEAKIISDFG